MRACRPQGLLRRLLLACLSRRQILQCSHPPRKQEVNNISDVNATDLTDGGSTTLHAHAVDVAQNFARYLYLSDTLDFTSSLGNVKKLESIYSNVDDGTVNLLCEQSGTGLHMAMFGSDALEMPVMPDSVFSLNAYFSASEERGSVSIQAYIYTTDEGGGGFVFVRAFKVYTGAVGVSPQKINFLLNIAGYDILPSEKIVIRFMVDTYLMEIGDSFTLSLHYGSTEPSYIDLSYQDTLTNLENGEHSGDHEAGIAGAALAFGNLCYLASADSKWELTDASADSTSGYVKIGFCVSSAAEDAATVILTRGNIRSSSFPAM